MTEAEVVLNKLENSYTIIYPGATDEEQESVRDLIVSKISDMLDVQAAQSSDVVAGITSVKAGSYSEKRGTIAAGVQNDPAAGGIPLTPLAIVLKYARVYRKTIEVFE